MNRKGVFTADLKLAALVLNATEDQVRGDYSYFRRKMLKRRDDWERELSHPRDKWESQPREIQWESD